MQGLARDPTKTPRSPHGSPGRLGGILSHVPLEWGEGACKSPEPVLSPSSLPVSRLEAVPQRGEKPEISVGLGQGFLQELCQGLSP